MSASFLKDIALGLEGIAFPKVCAVCAHLLSEQEFSVCNRCIEERLERCNAFEHNIIRPPGVRAVCSLWDFDKGGMLQDVLHKLKYQHRRGVAFDLGKKLGSELKNYFIQKPEKTEDWALLAVPLHP